MFSPDELASKVVPRPYQKELFEIAKEKNSIMILGTGSGKTLISILLIKELACNIRGRLDEGAKRTVFVVNTVPLVYQQSKAIEEHTGFSVGHYEGSMGVDIWSADKWNDELNKHEVLVMVAQIFKDLLYHEFIHLKQINLIIMDECHHATGNHPMREIMRKYNKIKCLGLEVPRIMGLTACVIHKKCKVYDIQKSMHKLEMVMDSVLVTSRDQDAVKRYTTCPQEMVVTCPTVRSSECFEDIAKLLKKAGVEVLKDIPGKCEKLKNLISKEISGILDVSIDLGEYILPKVIMLQAKYLKDSSADTYEERKALRLLGKRLESIPLTDYSFEGKINDYISGKVLRLIEILTQSRETEIVTLVFVTRRNTAKLLCSLLLELKNYYPNLGYLLPECVVGGFVNTKSDLKVAEELAKQKETVQRFRTGLCNLIVSTSVLEEGIDIRKCNLVIRYNEAANYRSYTQSLGRARAIPSHFITLAYEDKVDDVVYDRKCFKEISSYLNTVCHNRQLTSAEICRKHFERDEIEPPFSPFGIPGPQITFTSAMQIINRYCGTLTQFNGCKLNVIKRMEGDKFYVDLILPSNSPLKNKVTGNGMGNFDDAKRSAALAMCKELFRLNQFDKNLLPKKSATTADINLQKCLPITLEDFFTNFERGIKF